MSPPATSIPQHSIQAMPPLHQVKNPALQLQNDQSSIVLAPSHTTFHRSPDSEICTLPILRNKPLHLSSENSDNHSSIDGPDDLHTISKSSIPQCLSDTDSQIQFGVPMFTAYPHLHNVHENLGSTDPEISFSSLTPPPEGVAKLSGTEHTRIPTSDKPLDTNKICNPMYHLTDHQTQANFLSLNLQGQNKLMWPASPTQNSSRQKQPSDLQLPCNPMHHENLNSSSKYEPSAIGGFSSVHSNPTDPTASKPETAPDSSVCRTLKDHVEIPTLISTTEVVASIASNDATTKPQPCSITPSLSSPLRKRKGSRSRSVSTIERHSGTVRRSPRNVDHTVITQSPAKKRKRGANEVSNVHSPARKPSLDCRKIRLPSRAVATDALKSLLKISAVAKKKGIVWTKVKGHPYWPSQIVTEIENLGRQPRFENALRYRRSDNHDCVMYFGTCEIAFVNREKSCLSWDEGVKKGLHTKLKGNNFLDALADVRRYCSKNPRFPDDWWTKPKSLCLASDFINQASEKNSLNLLSSFFIKADHERIFWAKVRGFPQWPVQVLPRNMASECYPELKLNAVQTGRTSSMPCMFFGTAEVMMVSENVLTPFGAGVTRGYVSDSERQDLTVAIGEVWGYLQHQRIWPCGLLSKKRWWNHMDEEKGTHAKDPSELDVSAQIPYLPHYEHINKSVYADGVDHMSKLKGVDVSCCGCLPVGNEDRCVDSLCLNFASSFFCDPSTCLAGEFCKNITFHNRRSPSMTPFFTSDHRGWGVKVDQFVTKGTFVVEYVGEIINKQVLQKRLQRMNKLKSNEYYMMDLTNDLLVDAKFKGNLSRFINSSCEPNCETQKWTDPSTGQTHVGIFTIQDIPAGTELTYNYCFLDYGLSAKSQKRYFYCQCGTSSCCMLDPVEQKMMEKLIGRRIEVQWDDGWYAGTVDKYFSKKKRFRVQYDDGDCEDLVLGMPLADKDDEVPFRLLKENKEDEDGGNESQRGKCSGNGPGKVNKR